MAQIIGLAALLGWRQTLRVALARMLGSRTPVAVRLRGVPHPIYVRADGTDVNCLWQIFGKRDCEIESPRPPRAIIDGGAHIGLASIYFANRFPDATIIAVEPESSNYEMARRNLASYPNVRLVRGGIWCRDAWLTIENPSADTWGFRVRELPARVPGSFMGRSIEGLLRQFGLDAADLVKLDIEGAETEVFGKGPLRWLDRIDTLVIELHGRKAERVVGEAMERHGVAHHRRGEKVIFVRDGRTDSIGAPSLAGQ